MCIDFKRLKECVLARFESSEEGKSLQCNVANHGGCNPQSRGTDHFVIVCHIGRATRHCLKDNPCRCRTLGQVSQFLIVTPSPPGVASPEPKEEETEVEEVEEKEVQKEEEVKDEDEVSLEKLINCLKIISMRNENF